MRETIIRIWAGKSPLWKAFWYFFIGGYILLLILNVVLTGLAVEYLEFLSIEFMAIILFATTFVFLIIAFFAIRRFSKNTKWVGWVWISQGIVFLFLVRNFYSLYIVFTKHIPEINKARELLTNG